MFPMRRPSNRRTMFLNIVVFFLTLDQFDANLDDRQTNDSTTTPTGFPQVSTTSWTNDSKCVDNYTLHELSQYVLIPNIVEAVFILMHTVTFVVGLIGNALVCVAVYRNHSMRNVTNYFIVNLAVADFMVILVCLPATVVWDVTETWFWGLALCKIVLYLQTVSVTVSVFTLSLISVDRWYAICFPLSFKSFKSTTTKAKFSIFLIWILSLASALPDLIYLETKPEDPECYGDYFTQCNYSWPEGWDYWVPGNVDAAFYLLKFMLLYFVPLTMILYTYCQIGRVLWTSANIPNHYSGIQQNNKHSGRRIPISNTTESQLRSRRKAAKMLCAVVLMFAVCYFPVHVLNIVRSTTVVSNNEFTIAISNFIHWLLYANSAVNPIIYNFMSGNFRREFRRAFQHCHRCNCNNTPSVVRSEVGLTSQNEYGLHSFNRGMSLCSSKRTRTTSFITHAN